MTLLPSPTFEKPVKLLLVVANDGVPDTAIDAALAEMDAAEVTFERLDVPSANEIPTTIAIAARMSNFDGYVVLTGPVDQAVASALQMLGLQGLCIGKAAILSDDAANLAKLGTTAVAAALHLVATSRKWGRPDRGIGFTSEILLAQGGKSTA